MIAFRWVAAGTALFLGAADRLTDAELDAASLLPGWTRRHVLAHVASNATALERLVSRARSGRRSPMYASPEQRVEEIDRGALRSPARLRDELRTTADELAAAFESLPDTAWSHEVVTAQGRTLPATELPWLRAREVNVHAVDLDAGVGFDDLPDGFCEALVGDIAAVRGSRGDGPALLLAAAGTRSVWTVTGRGDPVAVTLPVRRLAGWLTGREADPALPALPPWL